MYKLLFRQGLRYQMPKLQFLSQTIKKLPVKLPMTQRRGRSQKIHLTQRKKKKEKKRIAMLRVIAVENRSMVRFLAEVEVRVLRSPLQGEKALVVDEVALLQTKVRSPLK